MKRGLRILATVSVALLFTGVNRVEAAGIAGFRMGAAVSNPTVEASAVFDANNRVGFASTGFWEFGMGALAIQPELGYITKGGEDAVSGTTFEFHYLEVATLLKAGIPMANVQPHVFGGVGADFELKSDVPLQFESHGTDWTAIFGADVVAEMGGIALVVDGRYALGLKDVVKASSVVSDLKHRTWVFSAGLGWKF